MNTSEKLSSDLEKILSGDPWYGKPVYQIIEEVGFEAAFEKPGHTSHHIAQIVLHMIAWTEEVMDRMNGLKPGIPASGDWPAAAAPTEQKWQNYVNDLKLVNVNMLGLIRNFPEEKWSEAAIGEKTPELGNGVSFEDLVNGLIHHHIYHSGQIAILNSLLTN